MDTSSKISDSPVFWKELFRTKFVNLIHEFMVEKGMNQSELATHLGVTKGRISQMLNDDSNPRMDKVIEVLLKIGRVPDFSFVKKSEWMLAQEVEDEEILLEEEVEDGDEDDEGEEGVSFPSITAIKYSGSQYRKKKLVGDLNKLGGVRESISIGPPKIAASSPMKSVGYKQFSSNQGIFFGSKNRK